MAKTIITAALTGAVTPAGYEIPTTPEQIAEDAYNCWKAGAAIVHLHMRGEDGFGSMDRDRFYQTVRLIRSHKDCDVIINCTSSGASPQHPATDEDRMLHHLTVPGIEMGSYDAGTFNWMPVLVFMNSPEFLTKLGTVYKEKGIKPEFEIFDSGMLDIVDYYKKKNLLPDGPNHYQFCLGVLGGMQATVENLLYLKNHIPEGATWSAFGVGKAHLPIMYATLALGGHLRVGMEDNVVYQKGIPATNVSLVERAVRVVKEFGNEVATPAEARKMLSIPELDAVSVRHALGIE